MARVVMHFEDIFRSTEGIPYTARAVCRLAGHTWEGWIEFVPVHGGHVLRTERETTQPKYTDVLYWASGLTHVYLEGALKRAEEPSIPIVPPHMVAELPAYDAPRRAVLDPFSVFAKGEDILRGELGALARRHLVAIIEDFALHPVRATGGSTAMSDDPDLARYTDIELIELIVSHVKQRSRRAA